MFLIVSSDNGPQAAHLALCKSGSCQPISLFSMIAPHESHVPPNRRGLDSQGMLSEVSGEQMSHSKRWYLAQI